MNVGISEPPAFRFATDGDIPALHALIERAYRGTAARAGWTHEADLLDGQRTDTAALAEMIADTAQVILLAEDTGVLVGCVALRALDDGAAYLGLLTVEPAGQARGLGRALLGAAEAVARDRGARRVEMTVIGRRRELVAWYERRGYRRTGETRPFPLDDPRFGVARTRDLDFVVLEKGLHGQDRSVLTSCHPGLDPA